MNYQLQATDFIDGEAIVRKGKKVFHAFALK